MTTGTYPCVPSNKAADLDELNSALKQCLVSRNAAVERHLPLVEKLVDCARRRRDVRGIERDDMVSEGRIALIEAVDGFDSTRGTDFVKYATHRIVFALLDFLRIEARHLSRLLSIDDLSDAQKDDLPNAADMAENDWRLDVENALGDVRELCRQAVTLHLNEGLTKVEVARRLKVSERHARRMIEHGLNDLRDSLAPSASL